MDTTTAPIRDRVRDFVVRNFYVADQGQLTDQASFLDAGIVDSTGVLEIIAFVESNFGFTIEDDEIVPDNLDSVARITAFIERKAGAGR